MNARRTRYAAVAAVFALAATVAVADDHSITINSVKQRWPWSNKVDITYTVTGGQDIAAETPFYAKIVFTATIDGTAYTIDGSSVGAEASEGKHTVAWIPPSTIDTKSLDCTMTAQLIESDLPSGNDFMIIDLTTGKVTYEGRYATLTPSTNRYNTATYKTTKMVLRKIPKWSDRSCLPNASALPTSGYQTGPGANENDYNVQRNWQTARDYYMALFPTTQAQYKTLISDAIVYGGNGVGTKAGDEIPISIISWSNLALRCF